jgi:P-type conjugative transfer protein TrbJ
MKKLLAASFIALALVLYASVDLKALVVSCPNCSNLATQMMERATSLETLQNELRQYQELIQQTQQQIALVQNNIQQYENMLQNTMKLPESLLSSAKGALSDLAKQTAQLNVMKGDYMALGQVFDEVYPGLDMIKNLAGGTSDLSIEEVWQKLSSETDRSAEATFQISGAQLMDLAENSTALDNHISQLLSTPEGQMQAISAGNALSSIQIAEAQKLRALLATSIQSSTQSSEKKEKQEQLAHEQYLNFVGESELLKAQIK